MANEIPKRGIRSSSESFDRVGRGGLQHILHSSVRPVDCSHFILLTLKSSNLYCKRTSLQYRVLHNIISRDHSSGRLSEQCSVSLLFVRLSYFSYVSQRHISIVAFSFRYHSRTHVFREHNFFNNSLLRIVLYPFLEAKSFFFPISALLTSDTILSYTRPAVSR